ncbi:unnamed protein product, partial [Rotaria sp. Silwood2]
ARFNQGLIDNCQRDINKYCQSEIVDIEKDDKEFDEDKDDYNDNNDYINDDDKVTDRQMGGQIIQCLRSKYADTSITLESQCVFELVDVIQTSKLDVKLDIKLYQSCRQLLKSECIGMDQEDCLILLYQKDIINDDACKEQVKRIIREGQADIHVDRALALECQADVLKYCNDIPIGSRNQLQCLLNMKKFLTKQCQNILQKRQALLKSVSNISDTVELTERIENSSNNFYLFSIILLISCVIFMADFMYGSRVRYNRIINYESTPINYK